MYRLMKWVYNYENIIEWYGILVLPEGCKIQTNNRLKDSEVDKIYEDYYI